MSAVLRGLVASVALTVAACASSPATRIVLPHPEVASRGAQTETGITVRLRRLTLPGYLEDYPVVIGRRGNALVVADKVEWGERLPQGVARVLREALSQRLGPSGVLMPGDHRVPDADLTIEFLSLDPVEGVLHLDARWFFSCRASRSGAGGRTRLEVPIENESSAAVANATTGALVRLVDTLAGEVQCDLYTRPE